MTERKTERSGRRLTTESREELEDQREFLLRSLDDLDNELVAGNIDPDTYRVLHDDYTARAAAVIQSINDGVERDGSDAPRVPPAMRLLTIGGVVVFAVLAAVLLAHTVGQRHAGQEITGDAQAGGAVTSTSLSQAGAIAAAKAAAAAQPRSYAARINYARALSSVDPIDAIKEYTAAAALDSKQAEPRAYGGWLTALAAQQVTDPGSKKLLLDTAERNLDQAIAVDPAYAASYVFKGLLYSQIENKQCAGVTAFQQYLVTAPSDDPMRTEVYSALAQAVKAGKCPSPPVSPTTKP